jgi:hypothetical protein
VTVYSKPLGNQFGRPRETCLKVAALSFGLLRVKKMISVEAADVFYHHKVFKFGKSHDCYLVDAWAPLSFFLFTIGDRNRGNLQYLEAEISRPRAATKDTNRAVSSLVEGSFWMRKLHGRDQHTHIYPPVNDRIRSHQSTTYPLLLKLYSGL